MHKGLAQLLIEVGFSSSGSGEAMQASAYQGPPRGAAQPAGQNEGMPVD